MTSDAQAILDRATLVQAQRDLRWIAFELQRTAPTIATRAGALARECELRLDALSRSNAVQPR